MTAWFWVLLAGLALSGGEIYRRLWKRAVGVGVTATGYGALLAAFLVGGEAYLGAPPDLLAAYGIILLGSAIYWIDDVSGLAPTVRLAIQFVSGAAVCYLLLDKADLGIFVLACLSAGLLNVFLTNAINFFDGADLNVATTMLLTVATILVIGPDASFMRSSALIILAFVGAFSLFNFWPRTLYFGDAGCFAFATFLTAMTVCYFKEGANAAAYAAIPMAFPATDVLYVLVLRARNGDLHLRSRNTLHLYQRLQSQHSGFWYLLPQLGNMVLVTSAAVSLQSAGLPPFWAVLTAGASVTPVFYALVRTRYVR